MIKKRNRKGILALFLICLLIFTLVFLSKYETQKRTIFSNKLNKIRIGMTLEEIEKMLGEPSTLIWEKSKNIDKFKVIRTEKVLIANFKYVFWRTGTNFYFDENKKYVYSDFFFN